MKKAAAKKAPPSRPPKVKKPGNGKPLALRAGAYLPARIEAWPARSVSVRDLRNKFALVSDWLNAGLDVTIMKNGKPYAQLTPHAQKKVVMPDFAARAKKIFGDRIIDTSEWTADIRKERFE